MSPPTAPARRHGLITLLANVLLCGLAGGAVWCLLALMTTEHAGMFLIVPLALAIAAFLRWQGYRGRRGALCATAATLIAFVYAEFLFAAVNVAQLLGFPLRETLFKMDFGLAWQLVRTHTSWLDIAIVVVACAAAAAMMWRRRR